jgi:uncharacterized protein YaaW (UPF0174 family)
MDNINIVAIQTSEVEVALVQFNVRSWNFMHWESSEEYVSFLKVYFLLNIKHQHTSHVKSTLSFQLDSDI